MRLRSTGLGRTELEGELVGVKIVDDLVIFFVNTTNQKDNHLLSHSIYRKI